MQDLDCLSAVAMVFILFGWLMVIKYDKPDK